MAIPIKLAFAPCNWPCSVAATRRLIRPIEAAFAIPQSDMSGMPRKKNSADGAKHVLQRRGMAVVVEAILKDEGRNTE